MAARRRSTSREIRGALSLLAVFAILYVIVRYWKFTIPLAILVLCLWILRARSGPKERWQLARTSTAGDEIFLDVETLRLSHEVEGGWSSINKFGLAVAVTWDKSNGFRRWFETDSQELIKELNCFSRVVTYNGDRFDLEVLRGYGGVRSLRNKSKDLLADLYEKLGFRVKLDQLAKETLGRQKSGSGLDAVKWWRQGEIEKVCNYCQDDVRILIDLVDFARANKYVLVDGRKVPVDW